MQDELQLRVQELEQQTKNLRLALEYYAAKENWYPGDSFKQAGRIDENDLEYFAESKTSDLIGGKLARQMLFEFDKVGNEKQLARARKRI
ncbi:MAG: hypothetical protein ABL930_05840 [Pseudobdellovibrio sp.]